MWSYISSSLNIKLRNINKQVRGQQNAIYSTENKLCCGKHNLGRGTSLICYFDNFQQQVQIQQLQNANTQLIPVGNSSSSSSNQQSSSSSNNVIMMVPSSSGGSGTRYVNIEIEPYDHLSFLIFSSLALPIRAFRGVRSFYLLGVHKIE